MLFKCIKKSQDPNIKLQIKEDTPKVSSLANIPDDDTAGDVDAEVGRGVVEGVAVRLHTPARTLEPIYETPVSNLASRLVFIRFYTKI